MSIQFAKDLDPEIQSYLDYGSAQAAIWDPRGRTVRFAPCRRTIMHSLPSGGLLFCKLRQGRVGDAKAEWRWLQELAELGFRVPQRLFFARQGAQTALGMAALPGRPMDALLAEEPKAVSYAISQVAPMVRRLHQQGLVFRDLYWNHLFAAADLDPSMAPGFIDLERVMRPRWRFRRWLLKDLAGLLASIPWGVTVSRQQRLWFLRSYLRRDLGGASPIPPGERRQALKQAAAKAQRIRDHQPKHP